MRVCDSVLRDKALPLPQSGPEFVRNFKETGNGYLCRRVSHAERKKSRLRCFLLELRTRMMEHFGLPVCALQLFQRVFSPTDNKLLGLIAISHSSRCKSFSLITPS
jgi:hypothetical protein